MKWFESDTYGIRQAFDYLPDIAWVTKNNPSGRDIIKRWAAEMEEKKEAINVYQTIIQQGRALADSTSSPIETR